MQIICTSINYDPVSKIYIVSFVSANQTPPFANSGLIVQCNDAAQVVWTVGKIYSLAVV